MRRSLRERSLEVCLQRLQAGEDLEHVLGAYPRWYREFRPILLAAQAAQVYADSIHVPETAQVYSRVAFLKSAEELIPAQATARRRRGKRLGVILLGLVVVFLVLAVPLFQLSHRALPGDLLYPIKLFGEQVEFRLAFHSGNRLALEFDHDLKRLEEIQTLLLQGRNRQVQFSDGLQQMQPGEWRVGDLRVLIPPDTRVVGDIQPGYYVSVIGRTQNEGDVLARQVQMREYNITGHVDKLMDGEWVVEGVSVLVDTETAVRGSPSQGSVVTVVARRTLDGDLYARMIEVVR